MRTLLLIVSILVVSLLNARGQEARLLVALQPSDWSVFEPDLDVNFEAQSQVVARRLLVEDNREGLVPFLSAEFSARAYFVALFQFDTSSDWAKHMLQLDEQMTDWSLSVNGQHIEIKLNEAHLVDVSSLVDERGRAVVVLTRNINSETQSMNPAFAPRLVRGISFRHVAIQHVKLNDDPFFGGKKIEVHFANFTSEAVDGKLVGRVFRADGITLVVENNNCAYARANMEFSVDISLPESENLLTNGDYVVEVEFLDKENADQLVDAIQVLVKL
jgi:hypothetical protein